MHMPSFGWAMKSQLSARLRSTASRRQSAFCRFISFVALALRLPDLPSAMIERAEQVAAALRADLVERIRITLRPLRPSFTVLVFASRRLPSSKLLLLSLIFTLLRLAPRTLTLTPLPVTSFCPVLTSESFSFLDPLPLDTAACEEPSPGFAKAPDANVSESEMATTIARHQRIICTHGGSSP